MLKYLLEKEFKQFFRNKFLPRVVYITSILCAFDFSISSEFWKLRILTLALLIMMKSSYSNQLIRKVESSGYYRIVNQYSTYNEAALENVELNKADIVLEIPSNFEASLSAGG
jgi:ABC-2 type transport system permease protein